ncbi:ShlB/FhaC/HecB family hemolysin secretion/activation protein [Rhodoferax sp.]|uniref:ShlB/FhaC/HecB family hemolysin secretion/activation protein n=1 Tax=Rhodoferax sp. TaxID=50421 RepID=UPI002718C165|nr:ShlB/FhaC/HecB family hemolysin secretion/activation protein [Rhodoferax sp.]MDO8321008.1 ShlB/FhaC/HecB family hemolysin secretion/activation protein [Rhodoferax sp.]
MPIKTRHQACTLILLALAANASAQQAVDAGALQQQLQRERSPAVPELPKPVKPSAAQAPAAVGPSFAVSGFAFIGNTLLSEAQLQAVVANYVGQNLTYAELQGVAAAVADAYREAGWVVRSYLPQQEVSNGRVSIQIVEAQFGQVVVQNTDADVALRVEPEILKDRVLAAQRPGEPVNTLQIDEALLLLEELSGVIVQGKLAPGQKDRETDLVLQTVNAPFITGDVRMDNTGSRATGSTQLSGDVTLASPTRVGDALDLNLMHTQGSDYARIAYRRPLGLHGAVVDVSSSYLRYNVVEVGFSALQASGSASTIGVTLGYPLLRTRSTNLTAALGAERKHYVNDAGINPVSDYRINTVGLSLSGQHSVGGSGLTTASLNFTTGKVDLSGSPSALADATGAQTHGQFGKLRYHISGQQPINERISLMATLRGQMANKNLDSAEKFYLGGGSGVRAYSSSEAAGSAGQLVNIELQTRLSAEFNLVGFYDWGRVQVNTDNAFPGAPLQNGAILRGAGLSLGWSNNENAEARLIWAQRIGRNPNALANGSDSDGTLVKHRFWLTASLYY